MVPFNILILLLLISPLIIRLVYDWWWIKHSRVKISRSGYLVRNLITGGLIVLAGVIAKSYEIHPPLLSGILFSYTIFFALFDYLLNLMRGLNFFYVSPDPTHNSGWERLRSSMPLIAEVSLKLWLVAVGAGCYYSYYLL